MNENINKIPVFYEKEHCYDICLEPNFLNLGQELLSFGTGSRKICIVSDSNVYPLYADELRLLLEPHAKTIVSFVFPHGEKNKTLQTVQEIYEFLIRNSFDRNDFLIALGGGVTGDLTGYAAATYLRGIRFIQIPTTLLSMVDSSIGGKTGVDFNSYKNMIGAFYMPKLVYMNISVLTSLPDREYYSGYGEIIKHGLIQDETYFNWLYYYRKELCSRDLELVKELVARSGQIKKRLVEQDPKEQGIRAILNFGHTFGHAIEKIKEFSFLHGECVSIGIAAAAFLSKNKGYISNQDLNQILEILTSFHLPSSVTDVSIDEALEAVSKDKKKDGEAIKFILLKAIGDAVISTEVTKDEMKAALGFVIKKGKD